MISCCHGSEELHHLLLVSLNSSHLLIVPLLSSLESGTPFENAIHLFLSWALTDTERLPQFPFLSSKKKYRSGQPTPTWSTTSACKPHRCWVVAKIGPWCLLPQLTLLQSVNHTQAPELPTVLRENPTTLARGWCPRSRRWGYGPWRGGENLPPTRAK